MQYADWAPLTAFTTALVTTWWLVRSRFFRIALDHPNRRSLHQTPVPRTGGLAVCAGILIGAAVVAPNLPMVIWIGCAVVLTISFADDVRGVPGRLRDDVSGYSRSAVREARSPSSRARVRCGSRADHEAVPKVRSALRAVAESPS